MKIYDALGPKPTNIKEREVRNKELAPQPPVQNEPKAQPNQPIRDQVSISTKNLLERAKSKVNAMPEIRAQRVEELKKQIASGTYQVSNREIARAMVGSILSELA